MCVCDQCDDNIMAQRKRTRISNLEFSDLHVKTHISSFPMWILVFRFETFHTEGEGGGWMMMMMARYMI